MTLRPVLLVKFRYAILSGGYQRLYEILKRAKSEGIDYTIVTDPQSCKNAAELFPDFVETIKKYRVFLISLFKEKAESPYGLRQFSFWKEVLSNALSISKIAVRENSDLIVNPGEGIKEVLSCYLASILASKPWTIVFQPTSDWLQPSHSIGPLTPLNVLAHVSSKKSTQSFSFFPKVGLSINILLLLKTLEKIPVLAVSQSLVEEFGVLDPRIRFIPIVPGNGVDLSKLSGDANFDCNYDGVFFGRLVSEKGIFDLIEVWKEVTLFSPKAVLAVCGIPENTSLVSKFLGEIKKIGLEGNIQYLGQQDRNSLFLIIKHSRLTLYPSYVDSFSLVTLESLACGTPVVAYDIPAIRHNFSNCKAVFRCPVGNKEEMAKAVIRILRMEEQRRVLVDEGRKFAVSFDWSNVVRAEKKAYQKVVENKRSI